MLTLFTTAKPFSGHSGVIQRNALRSWKLLAPDVEVILFGDEEGTAEISAELGLRHEPKVERHESGMKYLDYMFDRAQKIARHEFLCYSNCDIILMEDFWKAFQAVTTWRKTFLMAGQRWDIDIVDELDVLEDGWAKKLRRLATSKGSRQHTDFADFFVFPRGLYDHVPALVVGRSAWDAWLIWKAVSAGAPLVDCTACVVPVHQNHSYGYHPAGKQGTHEDPLAMRNRELAGGGKHLRTIIDATHRFTKRGSIRWAPLRRHLPRLPIDKVWQTLLIQTYPLRLRLGLRKQSLSRIRDNNKEI